MAKATGLGDNIFVEGRNLSGDTGAISRIASIVNLLDVPEIDQSSMIRLQGVADGGVDWQSWFNDATDRAHPSLSALPTTDVGISWTRGTTLGNPMCFVDAKQVDYPGTRATDGSLTFALSTQGSAGFPLEFGIQITAGQITHASATSSTGNVESASSSLGGVGYLQGFEVDSGTATVVIEDSSDTTNGVDGVWATLLTFATTSASWPAAERKTVTGTVNKGLRATTTGTFTNADFQIGFRRGLANDREDLS